MTKSKQPKVSIVVPIYNVEKYLNECVDSILAQTLKDIEVILVDDGSPDNSGKIVDEYAKKDKRVVAIHQKNAGYSVAVNKGIDLAKGEYIGIVESDDFIEADMYEELYKSAKKYKTDVTKGGFFYYDPTNPIWKNKEFANASGIDLRNAPDGAFHITEWPELIAFHASIWSSIYRADFVKKIKIPETAGASYQDFPFMVNVMLEAKRISVVKKPFVHWRNEPGQGNSTSAHGKKLLLMAKNSKTSFDLVKKSGYYEQLKEAFGVHLIWANLTFFYNIDNKYKREYYNRLHELLMPIAKDKDFQYKFFQGNDKVFLDLMTKYNWPVVKASIWALKGRNGVKKVARGISPSYKASVAMRDQLDILIHQNMELAEEIEKLKKESK